MKKAIIFAILGIFLLFAAGCGSKHYTITKQDGTSVVSVGEPEYSKKSNTYTFENLDGGKETLAREHVVDIKEHKK